MQVNNYGGEKGPRNRRAGTRSTYIRTVEANNRIISNIDQLMKYYSTYVHILIPHTRILATHCNSITSACFHVSV